MGGLLTPLPVNAFVFLVKLRIAKLNKRVLDKRIAPFFGTFHLAAEGGGASIVDKYSIGKTSSTRDSMGQRQPAARETTLS